MNYFNNITNYINQKLWNLSGIKARVVSDDHRNIQFITNNKCSRSINIYRITSDKMLDKCVELIRRDLINPAYN